MASELPRTSPCDSVRGAAALVHLRCDCLSRRAPAGGCEGLRIRGGYSTLWYAKRVAQVVAVDPNREWVDLIALRCGANARILHHNYPDEMDAYVSEIAHHGGCWDVVAVDSAWREDSSRAAVDHLSDRGVIVWDNSSLPEFAGYMRDIFAPRGFKELPLVGLVPIVPSFDRTSILYRPGNLLGI
jgi:hypothetical protein